MEIWFMLIWRRTKPLTETRIMDRNEILAGAEEAFFKALLAGYAGEGDGEARKEKSATGQITMTCEIGDFKVVDRYYITPNTNRSAGTTTISFKGQVIWYMSYLGFYDERAIDLLKQTLRMAYRGKLFNGGRGMEWLKSDTMAYTNQIERRSFCDFKGREEVKDSRSGELLGYHEYAGLSLI